MPHPPRGCVRSCAALFASRCPGGRLVKSCIANHEGSQRSFLNARRGSPSQFDQRFGPWRCMHQPAVCRSQTVAACAAYSWIKCRPHLSCLQEPEEHESICKWRSFFPGCNSLEENSRVTRQLAYAVSCAEVKCTGRRSAWLACLPTWTAQCFGAPCFDRKIFSCVASAPLHDKLSLQCVGAAAHLSSMACRCR